MESYFPDNVGKEPSPRTAAAMAAAVHVLSSALEAIMAHWLATMGADRAAGLLRDLEAVTARSAAEQPIDPLARDRYLLEVDRFGAAFFNRVRTNAEALRTGRRPLRFGKM